MHSADLPGERPTVRSAKVYALEGELGDADIAAIKHYVINRSRLAKLRWIPRPR